MNPFFITLLSLSFSGSLIILGLCALKPVIRHRLSKAWQYYIWLVVIIRLLFPFSPEFNLVGEVVKIYEQRSLIQNSEPESLPDNKLSMPDEIEAFGEIMPGENIRTARGNQSDIIPVQTKASIDYKEIFLSNLWIIWLLGAMLTFLLKVLQYFHFQKAVKKSCVPIQSSEEMAVFSECCKTLGVKRCFPIFSSPLVTTPMLIGLFHPQIVLPVCEFHGNELKFILLHELTHYVKRDLFYKWLVQITVCIHWFNPLVYLMKKEIQVGCELACDESIIKSMDTQNKQAYGNTLINMVSRAKPMNTALSMSESGKKLKERLTSIMKFNKKSKIITIVSLIFFAFVITGAVFVGVWKNQAVPEPNENESEDIQDSVQSVQKDDLSSAADYFKESVEKLSSAGVWSNWNPAGGTTYTPEQLSEKVYGEAKLIEQDFSNITELNILSLISENVIIQRGGSNVHIKFYQWYDDQYKLDESEGKLTLEHIDDKIQVKSGNNITGDWLPVVLKYLNLNIDPEIPDAKSNTITITIPNGVALKNVNVDSISGSLTVNDLTSDSCKLESISGKISIRDCMVQSLRINNISGNIQADRLSGKTAGIENISGMVSVNDCVFNDIKVNNISGSIIVDGGSGMLTADNNSGSIQVKGGSGTLIADSHSGSIELSDMQNREVINIDGYSGSVDIDLDDPSSYHIYFESFSGSIRVGNTTYSNNVNLNSDASKKLSIDMFDGTVVIH